ncbi:glucose 1-dehydrogenase [Mesorhizobium sp. M0437]|uniref:SDR family NAD(P)-dependent oxidoreductase n=1 Tax=unclassified Mesorhizobium TaxID=325217 RepID=UPI00333CA7E6
MSKLNGKVAIVTGASKGIGAAIAKSLATAGAAVVVNYASSREGADRVVAEIDDRGGRAVAVQGDVSQAADVRRLFEAAKLEFGGLDILVNNAGVFAFEPLEAVTEAEFHREFDINVLGIILTTQAAVKHFGAGGGSIINISSVASRNPQPNSLVYAATKGAVDTITLSMSRELGARNIRVNAIAPGGIDTEGLARIGIVGSEFENQIIAMTPLGRFGLPDDVARVAVFLASDEASWLTGERITASGGWR